MTDRTTINVSKEAHRKAQEAKEDEETWSQYLLRSTDKDAVEKTDPDLDEIHRKLDQIQGAQGDTVSEAIGLADRSMADLEREIKKVQESAEEGNIDEGEIARMVVSDLEGSLPRKIAEELHG